MPKLTNRVVSALKPKEDDFVVWDTEVRGFGIRVWPSGKKVFFLKYRNKHGRQRKPVVGVYGHISPERAREKVIKWLGIINDGGDPSGDNEELKNTPTLEEFADRYIDEYAKPNKKPRSVEEEERLLRNYIKPTLGKLKISAITKADMLRLHTSMRKTPVNANRARALLSTMFQFAEKCGKRPQNSNPVKFIDKFKEQKKERYLSNDELARIATELRRSEMQKTEMQSAVDAIRLLLFTGCRLNEILSLKWDYVDEENGCLRLPDSKTGAKSVYLAPAALEVLADIKRKEKNPYVFVGRRPRGRLINLQKPWHRILMRAETMRLIEQIAETEGWGAKRTEKAKQDALANVKQAYKIHCDIAKKLEIEISGQSLNEVRLHDLRHTFASVGATSKQSLQMIGKLLGHQQSSTTERYAHLHGDPLREAANVIVQRIAEAMMPNGEKRQAEVIELQSRKR